VAGVPAESPAGSTIQPAATVLLLRDGALGLEILLMQRADQLAFHGGAWAFPGGRVDPGDLCGADALAAARRAAVRVTYEESGLVIAPEQLARFSHWTTPPGRTRRFAAWFFLARAPADREAVVDGVEMRAHQWLGPRAALAAHALGELELPPPTFVSLSVLARWAQRSLRDGACACTADELLAFVDTREPAVFVPRLRAGPSGEVALYHGDAAYDGGELDLHGPRHRLLRGPDGYRYEQSA
jgi:8-oxo-dGTP pyrophosphatase MutT (NUDIX family)